MKLLLTLSILILVILLTFTDNAQAGTPGLPDEEILYGDANNDSVINVLDIIAIVSYIMGLNPDPFNFEAADVNNDGVINVLDLIFETNVIMETPGTPCAGMPTVTYEGQTYNTVQIGDQCWFKENMNAGTMIYSTSGGQLQTNNGIIEKYCYDNNPFYCDTFGGLYEWPEAMQYVTTEGTQGICPPGWHIPSNGEWVALVNYLGGELSGGEMKETGTNHWLPPNTGATNSSGFTGLPGGVREADNGGCGDLGYTGYFWSSSQQGADPIERLLIYDTEQIFEAYAWQLLGESVRCLKGCSPEPTQSNAGLDQLNVPGISTTLAGSTPTYGTGLWVIVSGTGGTIVTPTNPTTMFQGVAGNEYTLAWTITTQCGSSTDQVVISFAMGGTFTCGDTLTDDRDGQSYTTVLIGSQCWMTENLNVGEKINSSFPGGQQQTNNNIIEKYCYNNNISQCDVYGGLYEWKEAMQYVLEEGTQGICPSGWHIPSDNEWKIMEGTVDSQFPVGDPEWNNLGWRGLDVGGKLKEMGTTHWSPPNTEATNTSGFTALPGGYRYDDYGFFDLYKYLGYFWASSQYDSFLAWSRNLSYEYAKSNRNPYSQENGFSVRCLKDD